MSSAAHWSIRDVVTSVAHGSPPPLDPPRAGFRLLYASFVLGLILAMFFSYLLA